MHALELKVPPPVVGLLMAGAMWLVSVSTSAAMLLDLPWRVEAAIALATIGLAFDLAGLIAFQRGKTTINPMKPQATSTIIQSGVYRVSRNPMYIGMLFILSGWAVYLGHMMPFIFLPMFVLYLQRFQIVPEERALHAQFDPDYASYKKSVRRWL